MKPLPPWATVALGLVAGAGFYTLGTWAFSPDIIPWLGDVLARLAQVAGQPDTWRDLALTLGRTLTGFVLAFAVGVPLGIRLGRSPWSDGLLFLPLVLLQSCPPLFWVIPLILVLGTDGQAPLAIVFLVVLPLVTLAVREARKAIAPTLFDVFRIYAPRPRLVTQELILPAVAPALRTSLVLGLVLGLKSAVLGEWFGSHTGLGRSLFRLYGFFDMPGFFALVFLFLGVAAAVGLASEAAARVLFPTRRPWKPGSYRRGRPVPAAEPATVVLDNLAFGWGPLPLFRGVSLTVAPREVVMVSGPSGSGKTTLARLALGLLHPTEGRVVPPVRPAVLFQDDGLLSHRDVLGNTLLPARQWGTPDAEARARQLLADVGLAGEEQKFPEELSGGMRKRAALARALMQDPDFVVLDEPFQNLDEPARAVLWDLTFRLLAERGVGALIITHYPHELEGRPVRSWSLPGAIG